MPSLPRASSLLRAIEPIHRAVVFGLPSSAQAIVTGGAERRRPAAPIHPAVGPNHVGISVGVLTVMLLVYLIVHFSQG